MKNLTIKLIKSDNPVSEGCDLKDDLLLPTQDPEDGEGRRKFKGKAVIVVFALTAFVVMALKWDDVVEWVLGEPRLRPERILEQERQMKRIDDAEQYALIAEQPGYYECLLCAKKVFFLHKREVWKYGMSNQGQSRYSIQFLRVRNLAYVVQFRGTYSACLLEEKKKLFEYPLLPENLLRPDSLKLVLPPGNLQTR